ncbi:MAG: alcohol dehydrogenase (cytochrome c) [bacterium]|jgi:alcohol dehydrogenase (cytochrome c)
MNRKQTLLAFAGTLALGVAGFSTTATVLDVTIDDIMNDQATVDDIVSYSLGPRGQRYSPLDALTKDNIKNLYPV